MKHRPWFPYFVCLLGSFFYIYDYSLSVAPSVITHDLQQDFLINATRLGFIMSIFAFASSCFQIPAGMLLDRFGARKLLSLSILVSGIGALIFSQTHEPALLGLARFFMGIGSPFAFLGALYLVSHWFSARYFGFASGLLQFGAAIGSILGGAPLALLVNHLGWRESLWSIGWGTLVLSFFFFCFIRDGKSCHFEEGVDEKTVSLWQSFKIRKVWLISGIGFCSWVTVSGLGSLWGVPYLMALYHWSNAEAGSLYVFFWLGLGLGSPIVGFLSDRFHTRKIPFIVCFFIGLLSLLVYHFAQNLPPILMTLILFFLGFTASIQSLTFPAIKPHVPKKHFAAISGLINLSAVLSGLFMQPLMGKFMDLHAAFRHGDGFNYALSDYQFGLIPVAFFLGLGLILAFSLSEPSKC